MRIDWAGWRPYEISDAESFAARRGEARGVIVIADVAREAPIAHDPRCSTLTPDRFYMKIVAMGGRNGRYYFFDDLADAHAVMDARPCQVCSPGARRPARPTRKAISHERVSTSGPAGGVLDENHVVAAVRGFLSERGMEVTAWAHTSQTGPDIVATGGGLTVYVEAKGATSSLETSARYGRPFGRGEARINVAEALYTAVAALSRYRDSRGLRSAIALSADRMHRQLVEPLEPSLDQLKIGRFWVDPVDAGVVLEGPWQLPRVSRSAPAGHPPGQ
jgi:hypothetical protein